MSLSDKTLHEVPLGEILWSILYTDLRVAYIGFLWYLYSRVPQLANPHD